MEPTKEFFVGGGWSPAESILSAPFPEWWYKESTYPTDKKKQVYIDSHTFNLAVESKSIVFRWIIPKKPGLYSDSWEVPEDYRMASVMRLTVGEWGELTEKELQEVRTSRGSIEKEKIAKISELLQRSFLFNGLKIPYLDVRYDSVSQSEIERMVSFHTGKTAEHATLMANKLKDEEKRQKESLLQDVKATLGSKPDYLSILKQVVLAQISIEEAMRITGNSGVFQKGV
jgi:hypothetical protein